MCRVVIGIYREQLVHFELIFHDLGKMSCHREQFANFVLALHVHLPNNLFFVNKAQVLPRPA